MLLERHRAQDDAGGRAGPHLELHDGGRLHAERRYRGRGHRLHLVQREQPRLAEYRRRLPDVDPAADDGRHPGQPHVDARGHRDPHRSERDRHDDDSEHAQRGDHLGRPHAVRAVPDRVRGQRRPQQRSRARPAHQRDESAVQSDGDGDDPHHQVVRGDLRPRRLGAARDDERHRQPDERHAERRGPEQDLRARHVAEGGRHLRRRRHRPGAA